MTNTQRARERRRIKRIRENIINTSALLFILVLFSIGCYYEHNYTREAIVSEINEESGEVTFLDDSGHEWVACSDDVVLGQRVILKMNDSCSASYIGDDVITKIKPAKIFFAD